MSTPKNCTFCRICRMNGIKGCSLQRPKVLQPIHFVLTPHTDVTVVGLCSTRLLRLQKDLMAWTLLPISAIESGSGDPRRTWLLVVDYRNLCHFKEVNSTEDVAVSRETIENIKYLPVQVYQIHNVFGHSKSGYCKRLLILKYFYILFYLYEFLSVDENKYRICVFCKNKRTHSKESTVPRLRLSHERPSISFDTCQYKFTSSTMCSGTLNQVIARN